MHRTRLACALSVVLAIVFPAAAQITQQTYPLPAGAYPHDVAVAPDGSVVWWSDQNAGALGKLDPRTGRTALVPLGPGSAPHGVIAGPDGAAWLTDGGANVIVRVDPKSDAIVRFALPPGRGNVNLNTATFSDANTLWFTGMAGVYGRLDTATGRVQVFDAPRGAGPYGMNAAPGGPVYFASIAGHYVGRIDPATSAVSVLQPPTPEQGARRVWADSRGRVYVSEWMSGNVSRYDPTDQSWRTWRLPGREPGPYAVYVDDQDAVWLSDWGANAIVRFDPRSETFEAFPSPRPNANVRQILGRPGEIWVPESGTAHIVVFRTR